eukprot:89393_1
MSATEIVTIIKAINDHVTVKYCDVILAHLNDKMNDHLKFERAFFHSMDQAVQKLINSITSSLDTNPSSQCSTNMLAKIQMHCDDYNRWKKNVYDDHLQTMQQVEKNCNLLVQKTLKEKLVEQHNLFDNTLSIPAFQASNTNDINSNSMHHHPHHPTNSGTTPCHWESQPHDINQLLSCNDQMFNDSTTNSTVFSNDNCEPSPEINLNLTMLNFSAMSNTCTTPPVADRPFPKQPIAPPKPPPPTIPYDDSESSNGQQYECSICDKQFDSQLQWLSHLRTHQKTTKSTKKKKRKRVFSQMDANSTALSFQSNKANKRRRYRFQCEYCDKRYFRLGPFIKHYNNHMKNTENNICNFCCATFPSTKELQQHISTYNAGMCFTDGYHQYQCCQCSLMFQEKVQLNSHIKCKHKMNTDDNTNVASITNPDEETNTEFIFVGNVD